MQIDAILCTTVSRLILGVQYLGSLQLVLSSLHGSLLSLQGFVGLLLLLHPLPPDLCKGAHPLPHLPFCTLHLQHVRDMQALLLADLTY